jgi:hypothetical protein
MQSSLLLFVMRILKQQRRPCGPPVHSINDAISLPSGFLQQRIDEFLKRQFLLGGQQFDVPFVIDQKGTYTDHGPWQVTGSLNTLFNLISPFVNQGTQFI